MDKLLFFVRLEANHYFLWATQSVGRLDTHVRVSPHTIFPSTALSADKYAICSDAANTRFVYDWRQEQERSLRALKGTGMSEDQVTQFVNGCKCILSSLAKYCLFLHQIESQGIDPKRQ